MYKKLVNALYLINVISQAIITLLIPIGVGFGISFLLVSYAGAPRFLYAIFITLGAISGFYSMIKFIITAMAALDRLEKERSKSENIDKKGNGDE